MKILLTGSSGFIGSHYYNHTKNNNQVTPVDLVDGIDLCDYHDFEDQDVVVHMAATNGTKLFYDIPTDVSFNNTLPTFNLIKRFRGTSAKFVFTSTCEIFNDTISDGHYSIPTDENVPVMFKDITNSRWSYSLPKALGENLVANSDLDYLIIRYFNIYGPRQKDHFITEFVERCKNGEYYINGNDTRSFCYIDDAVNMTHELVKNHSGYTVNVGRNEEHTIEEVALIIMELMGIKDKLEIRPGRKGSATRRCPNTDLLYKLTGFNNYTPLRVGMEKTLEDLL